jgi:CubicO group peptidase (beta-lactamase class C family)
MTSAMPTLDARGTFIGSSFVHATARDFARFGLLHLHDGVVGDARVLPEGWVEHGRTPTAVDEETGFGYGAHWWLWPDQPGSMAAHGYEGQYVVVVPERELVVVRLGKTPAERRPPVVEALRELVGAFPAVRPAAC